MQPSAVSLLLARAYGLYIQEHYPDTENQMLQTVQGDALGSCVSIPAPKVGFVRPGLHA